MKPYSNKTKMLFETGDYVKEITDTHRKSIRHIVKGWEFCSGNCGIVCGTMGLCMVTDKGKYCASNIKESGVVQVFWRKV